MDGLGNAARQPPSEVARGEPCLARGGKHKEAIIPPTKRHMTASLTPKSAPTGAGRMTPRKQNDMPVIIGIVVMAILATLLHGGSLRIG